MRRSMFSFLHYFWFRVLLWDVFKRKRYLWQYGEDGKFHSLFICAATAAAAKAFTLLRRRLQARGHNNIASWANRWPLPPHCSISRRRARRLDYLRRWCRLHYRYSTLMLYFTTLSVCWPAPLWLLLHCWESRLLSSAVFDWKNYYWYWEQLRL